MKGVLLFAYNNGITDYLEMAIRTAKRVNQFLNLPVSIVTDIVDIKKYPNVFDKIITSMPDTSNTRDKKVWINKGRYQAYDLSPYDETILLDTDYLVLDDSLLKLFKTDFDYKLMHHNVTPNGPSYEMMGETSLPYIWATVVVFNKTEKSRLFFDLIGRIQRNYRYYKRLYNIREGNYRNDYAFAIANNIINGYSLNEDQGIPWRMYTVDKPVKRIMLTDNFIRIYYEDSATVVPYQGIHLMDKDYLLSRDFEQVLEVVCGS